MGCIPWQSVAVMVKVTKSKKMKMIFQSGNSKLTKFKESCQVTDPLKMEMHQLCLERLELTMTGFDTVPLTLVNFTRDTIKFQGHWRKLTFVFIF